MRLILSILLFTSTAFGQTFGLDTLAGAKYPKEVRAIPNQYATGFFAETFGDAFPVVKKEILAGRILVRVHFIWSDSHTFGDRDIPTIKRLARKYAPLCPSGRLEISPFCEHNVAKPDKYLDIVAKLMPGCTIVNTPWRGGFSKKYKNEIHGDHHKPQGRYNYSFDGTNAVDFDGTNAVDADIESYKAKHKGADVFFVWNPRLNLKWSMKDTTPRPQRNALPTKEMISSLLYVTGEKGSTSLPPKWLLKSHAEKHGATDLKGDKQLFIAPIKTDKIELRRNGNLVDTLSYYGPFDGGGYRYYSKKWGYQNGKTDVFVNGRKVGSTNNGFRDGVYR